MNSKRTLVNAGKIVVSKKPTAVYLAESFHDTMFLHPSGVYLGWDCSAIFPGEMRELPGASVVKSIHRISSIGPDIT